MSTPYELIYWKGAPARGEHIRLCFEETGTPYSDTARLENCNEIVPQYIKADYLGDKSTPPYYAPPLFKHGDLMISQTSNILMYVAPKIGLAPKTGDDIYKLNALALTALDGLSNEVHDCHHPIAHDLYYEDQVEESIRRSKDWVKSRLPKHLGFWQRVIQGESSGEGPWVYGGNLTYVDLVLFQCIDGVLYAFPRAMKAAKESGKYNRVFELYGAVKARPRIAGYLASERRQEYTIGIYRYYKELDVVAEDSS
ncbi:glutathione S-transferase protein-like protein [Hypoxylon trugodes]|uniref:glutathione S-transferase protein-like protein n=1 Tax=Hypoxylon trugodes TaxID=326681 RepID=UPI0021992C70|nr:glutathione S-transferase protein-like protein [Hypoxylon trugodes]KAI1386907.1 glutathione S-transferase protein-like protein [Hypoxylon trugodes]